jgi:hypothetical protein
MPIEFSEGICYTFDSVPDAVETLMQTDFSVGDRVRLIASPPYLKTAAPMPMLRSTSLVAPGEVGVILGRQPGNYWSVRFTNGVYLLERQYLEFVGQ